MEMCCAHPSLSPLPSVRGAPGPPVLPHDPDTPHIAAAVCAPPPASSCWPAPECDNAQPTSEQQNYY